MITLREHLINAKNSFLSNIEIEAIQKISNNIDIRLIEDSPTFESVNSLLPTLQARFKNAQKKNLNIIGIYEIIEKLKSINGNEIVIGYPYNSSKSAANIYYIRSELIGVNIIFLN